MYDVIHYVYNGLQEFVIDKSMSYEVCMLTAVMY